MPTQSEVVRLRRDRDFWKHLEQTTVSLDALKAKFMEDMLHEAVEFLRDYQMRDQGIAEFVQQYDDTWGKEYADRLREEM